MKKGPYRTISIIMDVLPITDDHWMGQQTSRVGASGINDAVGRGQAIVLGPEGRELMQAAGGGTNLIWGPRGHGALPPEAWSGREVGCRHIFSPALPSALPQFPQPWEVAAWSSCSFSVSSQAPSHLLFPSTQDAHSSPEPDLIRQVGKPSLSLYTRPCDASFSAGQTPTQSRCPAAPERWFRLLGTGPLLHSLSLQSQGRYQLLAVPISVLPSHLLSGFSMLPSSLC